MDNSQNTKKKIKPTKMNDDSSSYDSDSSYDEGTLLNEDGKIINEFEYRKLLASIFPSKHANKTVKQQKKIKKSCEDEIDISKHDNRVINSRETDSETSDLSEDDEDDEPNKLSGKPMSFNLFFTVEDELDDTDVDDDSSFTTTDAISEEEEEGDEGEETFLKEVEQQRKLMNKKDDKKKKSKMSSKEIFELLNKKKSDISNESIDKINTILQEEEEKIQKQNKKNIIKNSKKFRKLLYNKSKQNEQKYFKSQTLKEQQRLITILENINKHTKIDRPYKISLIDSDIPFEYKTEALKKLNSLDYMDQGTNEYYKIKNWIDTFMKIPFGKYSSLPITIDDGIDKCNSFMTNAKDILNNAVYGLDDAKIQILQMMGQWISNPNSVGSAIAIKGPMGTGKTTLVKNGISKILNRPFSFIALGGATDSSFLEGHSYTYEGSVCGRIVDILIKSKCMNPVIYFDELDKVSDTAKGEEIIGILTHLTDTTQNSQFHDKYFSGIDFDLSKCLFIFSYNDESKINPILKDRMYRIETKGYSSKEKNTISNNYLIPSIEKNVNFNKGNITITDKAIEYMIREYTDSEKGVRNLKRCIEIIYTKLNMYRLMKPKTKIFKDVETFEVKFPFTVDEDIVKKLIKKTGEKHYSSMYI